MHQGKGWIHTKKTTNILLIVIAVLILIMLLSLISAYRQSQKMVIEAERFLSSKFRPVTQFLQNAENAVATVGNAVGTVGTAVGTVGNAVATETTQLVQQLESEVQQLLNELGAKIQGLLATKNIINNKKLDSTYKKLLDLNSRVESEMNNPEVDELMVIKFNKEFDSVFKGLMLKSNNNKHLKLYAIKHKMLL